MGQRTHIVFGKRVPQPTAAVVYLKLNGIKPNKTDRKIFFHGKYIFHQKGSNSHPEGLRHYYTHLPLRLGESLREREIDSERVSKFIRTRIKYPKGIWRKAIFCFCRNKSKTSSSSTSMSRAVAS